MTERVKSDIYIEGPGGSRKLLTVPSYWHYHPVLKLLGRLQSKSYIQYPGTRITTQLRTSSIDLLKRRWCITTISFSWWCLAWQTRNTLRFKVLWPVAQKPKLSHVSCSKYWCHYCFSVFIIITDNRWECTQQVRQLYQASGEQVKSWRVEATDKLKGWLRTIQKDVKRPKNKNRLTKTSRKLNWIVNSITEIYIFSSQTLLGLNREYLISSITGPWIHTYSASCGQCCSFEAVLNLLCQNRKISHWWGTQVELQLGVRRNNVRFHTTIFYYACRKRKATLTMLNPTAWSSSLPWNSSLELNTDKTKTSAQHEIQNTKNVVLGQNFITTLD